MPGTINSFPISTSRLTDLPSDGSPAGTDIIHVETAGGTDEQLSLSALNTFLAAQSPQSTFIPTPGVVVSGNVVSFNGTTGKVIQDSGVAAANIAHGPGSAVSGNIPSFNGTGGTLLQDSGVLAANVAQGPASAVSGNLPSFNGTGGKTLQDSGVPANALQSNVSTPGSANLIGTNTDGFGIISMTGGFTYTLPQASANPGRVIRINKIDSGGSAVTIAAFAGDSIIGSNLGLGTTVTIPVQYSSITFECLGGTSWIEIGRNMKYSREKMSTFLGGTTYNSVALNVTSTNGTLVRAVFVPYQTWDGDWKLNLSLSMTLTSLAATQTITIAGIVFKNVANFQQAIPGSIVNSLNISGMYCSPNTGNLVFQSAGNGSPQTIAMGGGVDPELDSKPTWLA